MGITFEENNRTTGLREVANRMMIAARTAPKAGGVDNLVIAAIGKEEIKKLSDVMIGLVKDKGAQESFLRDAENILSAELMVLIGTRIRAFGVSFCGLCGHKNCSEKNEHPSEPCAFNTHDLGLAVGSAVTIAMDARVDNRLMYSVGMAVRDLKMLGEEAAIVFGIPLSCTGKNPFFDRKWPKRANP
jgi:uncharacterized ferredoxin-like protein